MKKEGLEIVRGDLTFLFEEWDQDISDTSLRDSAVRLRKLLVDKLLLGAWKELGFPDQPTVVAPGLKKTLSISPHDLKFAQAGGAEYKGTVVINAAVYSRALTGGEIAALAALGVPPHLETYRFVEFVESPCMVIQGTQLSRRVIVQYVTNKLGGAHYDEGRDSSKAKESQFALLDGIKGMEVADKNCIYYELLSIGQSVVHSDDISRLRDRLGNALP